MRFTIHNNWDEYKKSFISNFTPDDEYVVCGFGGGFNVLKKLFPNLMIKYILDAKSDISSNEYNMFTYDNISDDLFSKRKFIITPGCEYFSEIKHQLISIGAAPNNIASINEVLYFWGVNYLGGKLYSSACSLLLLTSCNLRCRGCTQYVPYVNKFLYVDIETVKSTIDNYFSIFDFVGNLMPVGGETLLYKELGEILNYINSEYSDRYSRIQIFTNGIITPSDQLAEIMSKTKNLQVMISDYSNSINSNTNGIINVLEKYNIKYTLNNGFGQSSENRWFDLGNPNFVKHENDSVTKERFNKCSLICNSIINQKLYYCAPSCHSKIGNIHSDKDEYCLDMKKIRTMGEEKYDVIGQFLLGFPSQGYLENCKYCNGYGQDINQNFMCAGEQLGKYNLDK